MSHTTCTHATTPAARRACRKARLAITTMLAEADFHFADQMEANAATPYVHADYERAQRQLKAALMLAFEGNDDYVETMYYHMINSGETFTWLWNEYGYDLLADPKHI